ncbi:hypothetical protein B0H11DRAFT_1963025 [Mycena galericulata]|nr:hypothetical protein B0H11DRAFT_1963025 [Mycena galericulata]
MRLTAERNHSDASGEIEALQSQVTKSQRDLEELRLEKDRTIKEMRITSEREAAKSQEELKKLRERLTTLQTEYERSQTTSRTEMQVLERRIKESQNEINALRVGKDKMIQTLRDDVDHAQNTSRGQLEEKDKAIRQLQDTADQKVIDIEIKFQETLKNSQTKMVQLVTIIMERDKLILRMREEITRMTMDTKAQILRIENRHREEERTFYSRLEEKDETMANLERENLKGRTSRV